METGLYDSNGISIKAGDTILYEYVSGFNRGPNDEKIDSFPFSETENVRHETVIRYQVKQHCAGYFLDIPATPSFINALHVTLKYSIISHQPILSENIVITNSRAAVIIFHKNVNTYPKKWIESCINSIKKQTYKDFDVFEIDYGGTGQQIYEGSNFDSFVLDNHALAHNYLLDKVFSLNYDCAFNVNIDDVYTLDRFEKQIACIERGYDIVASNYYNMDEYDNTTKLMQMSDKDIDIEQSKNHNIIAHPVVCYSRNFWTTCKKLMPEEIPFDDFEMWKRNYGSRKYKFVILPDYLLYYRIHEKKVSKS